MSEVKIRTIPRSNEKPASASRARRSGSSRNMARIFIALSAAVFVLGGLGYWNATRQPVERQIAKARHPFVDRIGASINRHLYDTHLMEQMRKRKSLLENQASKNGKNNDYALLPESDHSYGVQFDHENTAERLYEQLNHERPTNGDNLEDKINAKLANRKWLNEMERTERINFVRNFIRQAYDRGYEVTLDQNLVVIGVKKITTPKQVNIDQVLDRLAKQGH